MKLKNFLLSFAVLLACAGKAQPILYSQFGAVGDGKTDDFEAIVRAHDAANRSGTPVRADAGAVYYIGGAGTSAVIRTDTDWGDARFIIDDTQVENHRVPVFVVSSALAPVKVEGIETLEKGQEKLGTALGYGSLIVVEDDRTMQYIRYGANQNNGKPKTDLFVVDEQGRVDMQAPVIWDFDRIGSATAYPIDRETLTVIGGRFTTIANREKSNAYYARGITVRRSNVVVDGIYHTITGESDHGAPYGGFIVIENCAQILVRNCSLSGHRVYPKLGSAGVLIGTYDLTVNKAVNVTFKDCVQLNDIHDRRFWGVFASNYSKNITFDGVVFSRFDAHMGVANATIRNSVLGHMGVNLIGSGSFLMENTKVYGKHLVNLRSDYGSTWDGEILIRNCEFIPRNGSLSDVVVINGENAGMHDFGYACRMPRRIVLDGLTIRDTNTPDGYAGPKLFADFNPDLTDDTYVEKYPYTLPDEVVVNDLHIASGKPYAVSANPYMFRHVAVTER